MTDGMNEHSTILVQVKMKTGEEETSLHFQKCITMNVEDRDENLVAQNTCAVSHSCKKKLNKFSLRESESSSAYRALDMDGDQTKKLKRGQLVKRTHISNQ